MNEVIFIVILYISIAIHELGHLIALNIFEIKVKKYQVGIGTSILNFYIKGIEFNLKLIPIGGMIMPDESDYEKMKLGNKLVVCLSGVLANLSIAVLGLFIYAKGDINIVSSIVNDILVLIKNYLSFDKLTFYDNSFSILLTDEVNSVDSIILNHIVLINFGLFLLNLIPIPPLDGSKLITEPLTLFFIILGFNKVKIIKTINILSVLGIILMFIPITSNIILKFIRENLKLSTILYVIIGILICLIILEVKTEYLSRKIFKK
ncbi:site-2 protease family protein [Clostridium sp. 'White wine YQ']|uniref:site-2 protease family protein n=1 Tax=Clostridium sp. 'White wine YQ' TaxID=3027474 RepID=UPI002366F0CB|nr:site-2 protease family protein [Clostridium sp. 'White wine YQ']MDD7795000.1 site-2 protease family protein [Clostridium sp. 'White wine YQ']